MTCPKYIDYTRECIREIEFMPENTLEFCETDKFKKCPFYEILSNKKGVCKNIKECPAFERFTYYDFENFVKIANEWCTSEKHKKCSINIPLC